MMDDAVPTQGEEGGPLVLVVDDEEWMRDACRLILRKSGVRVITAPDANSGIELACHHKPALVLVDVRMPGMSGLDFLRRLKALDPEVVGIVITGYATIDVAVDAMKAGAHEFLPKPFEPAELRDVVRRALDHRQVARGEQLLGPKVASLRGVHMAVLAHQLKSPLASLRQCVSVVLHGYTGEIPEKARGMMEIVARRADQMISLVSDWLTLVRLEEGSALEKRVPVDLDALLTSTVESASKSAETSQIDLHLEPSTGGAEVLGDPGALGELFSNLVTNAVRYVQPGGRVHIAVRSGEEAVEVRVADDGPGIPLEEQEKIFEPFYRGKAQRGIPGDGLGLPIARRIARAHGGELLISSSPGKGTEFTIRLPVGGPAAEQRLEAKA